MKKFREYISEEVVPSALVANGAIDIDNEEVRASINLALAKVTADGAITPYIALNRISKALAYFHIILPKRIYLEGAKGVEVHEIRQFGHKMGMTDQGEFVHDVPGKYFLFMQYGMIPSMAGHIAYPHMGGTFRVMAKVVDQVELDRLVSMAELALAEHCDAEMQQNRAKVLAPHETMHDITSDEKKVGNKKAVAVSDKKKVNEGRMPASVIKHKQKLANMTPEEKAKKFAGKSEEELKSMARRHGYGKDSTEYSKHVKKEQIDETPETKRKGYLGPAPKGTLAHPDTKKHMRDLKKKYPSKSGPIKPYDPKDVKEEQIDETSKAAFEQGLKKYGKGPAAHKANAVDAKRDYSKMREKMVGKGKDYETTKKIVGEEQIDEISKALAQRYGEKAYQSAKSAEKGKADFVKRTLRSNIDPKHVTGTTFDDTIKKRVKGMHSAAKIVTRPSPKQIKEDEQLDEISHKLALKAMKKSEKRADDEYEADQASDRLSDYKTHEDRAKRLRGHMRKKFGNDKPGRGNTGKYTDRLGDQGGDGRLGVYSVNTHGKRAGLPPKEQVNRLKSNIKFSLGKHHKPNLPEETQIDELSKNTLKSYIRKASSDRVVRSQSLDSLSQAAGDRGYEKKSEIDQGGKLLKKMGNRRDGIDKALNRLEETQLDELSKNTLKSYKKAAESDKRSAESSAETSRWHKKNRALPLASRIAHGNEEKWLKGIAKKREKGIAMADKRLEEKAPPGAKFERMVKHIKAGYAKDGELTKKEKSIAFATAWKAKNRQDEELKFDPSTEIPRNS